MSLNLEELKKSVITEVNRIRADPHCYIPILKEYSYCFDGMILRRPDDFPIKTKEGPAAYEQAIAFLKKQKPLNVLTHDARISRACEDLLEDIGQTGQLSHETSDRRNVSDRLEAYAEWSHAVAENIDAGARTGQDVVVSFLVDDGISSRCNRENLFKPDFNYIGVSCGLHKDFDVITVVDFVADIRDKGVAFYDPETFRYNYPKDLNTKAPSVGKEDPDAPEDSTYMDRMSSDVRERNGKRIEVTKKLYTLKDGSKHIVEKEEF